MDGHRALYRALRHGVGSVVRTIPWVRRRLCASVDYAVLTRSEAYKEGRAKGWLGSSTARRQNRAYDRLLADMRAGHVRVDFAVAAKAVRRSQLSRPSLLEVGCGSGYYSQVFESLLTERISYVGLDSSSAMITIARQTFPHVQFTVGDACALPFRDGAFDIVFNGVSLMHVLDYEGAIAEGRRVARRFCIYHSVPVFTTRDTTYFRKYAYGARVVEIVFNRQELFALFSQAKLELVESWRSIDYDVYPVTSEHSLCETYLLRVAD